MAEKFNYVEMQTMGTELIQEFGQVGKIIYLTQPNKVFGGKPGENSLDADLVPVSFEQALIDGTNIVNTDRMIYISSVGLPGKPSVNDVAVVSGVRYSILDIDPYNFDGITNVVFAAHGRVAG